MDKVVDFNINQQGGFCCWSCYGGLSARALFCNHCGTIQPVREADCFQRLGLERKVDIDPTQLEKNYAQLQRSFSPERFIIRSQTEKGHAEKHRAAIQDAYDTLRDPIRRSRVWIDLHDGADVLARARQTPTIVGELQDSFMKADATPALDKLAQRTGQEIEFGILRLLASLRAQDWPQANMILAELDGLETLIAEIRSKRLGMTPQVER